jgi:site-specific recombinase XerC
MIGSRPLSNEEIINVSNAFTGSYATRDRALFILGLKSGFRISEMLSLKVSDVWKDGKVTSAVSVARKQMKGKVSARKVPLNPEAVKAIEAWLDVCGTHRPEAPLFESQRKGKAISRVQAYRILEEAYTMAGASGKLGTHAMRKTFAHGVYEALGHDLVKTQRALGHKNINSTVSYLGFGTDAEVNDAIMGL